VTTTEVVHEVALEAVAYEPDAERLSLVFVERGGQAHRMELPYWAAHQLARALGRFGISVEPPAVDRL
jgi:hypothetical protein